MQVLSGQLEGTLFDVGAARALERAQETSLPGALCLHCLQGKAFPADGQEKSARDAAVVARKASRVLRSLPSRASHCLAFSVYSQRVETGNQV